MRTRLVVLTSLLALAACGQQGSGGPRDPQLPDDGDALVLRVTQSGGFAPEADPAPLPWISVYRDGRVLSQGPVAAIYPPFAWPNVQVNPDRRRDPRRAGPGRARRRGHRHRRPR